MGIFHQIGQGLNGVPDGIGGEFQSIGLGAQSGVGDVETVFQFIESECFASFS